MHNTVTMKTLLYATLLFFIYTDQNYAGLMRGHVTLQHSLLVRCFLLDYLSSACGVGYSSWTLICLPNLQIFSVAFLLL